MHRDRGGNTPDFCNREYLWAKSHGFPSESHHGFTDAHHLRAADKSVNGDRGNLDFDEGGQAHNECAACRFDADSWDPGPSRRGDVAQPLLYIDLRYDGSDGISARCCSGTSRSMMPSGHGTTSSSAGRSTAIRSSTIPSGCRAFGVVSASEC